MERESANQNLGDFWFFDPFSVIGPSATRPLALIGQFSRLCGSHLNTSGFVGYCELLLVQILNEARAETDSGEEHCMDSQQLNDFPVCYTFSVSSTWERLEVAWKTFFLLIFSKVTGRDTVFGRWVAPFQRWVVWSVAYVDFSRNDILLFIHFVIIKPFLLLKYK